MNSKFTEKLKWAMWEIATWLCKAVGWVSCKIMNASIRLWKKCDAAAIEQFGKIMYGASDIPDNG